jgi:CheY-specific phosphatase CheX
MNAPVPELSESTRWQAAIAGAATEIAMYALGFDGAHVGPADLTYSGANQIGAHLPLLGGKGALEVALVGTEENCRRVAAAMLQTTPESLTMAEVADAVGEALNMLGGAVKRRVQANGNELELGLPLFVIGHVQQTDHITIIALPTHFGPIEMYTLVIGRRT